MIKSVLSRPPFDSPWVRDIVARYGLVTWFAAHSIAGIAQAVQDTSLWFFDARLYLRATRAWLEGGDPWAVQMAGNHFAAPPISMIPFAPLTLLQEDAAVGMVAGLVIVGAVATIRVLRLPWWWLLFPPLVQCILSANIHGLLVPLILLRGGALAVILKIYAVVPLLILGRWVALAGAAVLIVITAPLLPWATYLAELGAISATLADQTKHHIPVLVLVLLSPLVVLSGAVVGRARGAWLVTLALWPSQQYYYGTLALATRSGLATAIVALPMTGAPIVALFALAVVEWRRGTRPTLVRRGSGPISGPSVR